MSSLNENVLNISEEEAWETLYSDITPTISINEKTIPMMIEEIYKTTGRKLEYGTMKRQIEIWVKEGKLKPVGVRFVAGNKIAQAWIST